MCNHPSYGYRVFNLANEKDHVTEYSATDMSRQHRSSVTPAKVGGQMLREQLWIPALAGMTTCMGGVSDTQFCVLVLRASPP
jgi:hypothetical protein